MVIREIETNRDLNLAPIGFIDDNPKVHNRKIMGYPVLGSEKDLGGIIGRHGIKEIIISFKENGNEKKRAIQELCLKNYLEVEVRQMRLIIS